MISQFNPDKHKLGNLCNFKHEWGNTNQSLRYINCNSCVACAFLRAEKRKNSKNEEIKIYKRNYYLKNQKRLLKEFAEYRKLPEVRERNRQYHKTYRCANIVKARTYQQEYRKLRRVKEQRARYAKKTRQLNPEKFREKNKEYRATENGRKNASLARKRRKSIKRSTHFYKYSIQELSIHFAKFNDCCAYCGKKEKITIDHVIPLSRGGTDTLGNIVPACQICNSSKYTAEVESWYKQQSFFTIKRWKMIRRIIGNVCDGQLTLL